MRFPYFVAHRFSYSQEGKRNKTRIGVKVATFGIAIGVAIMIVSVSVLLGFKKEVSSQVIGFGSHIQISSFDSGYSFDKQPIILDEKTLSEIEQIDYVDRIEKITTKPGIVKTNSDFQGVVFKGVDADFDWSFYKKNILEGEVVDYGDISNKNKILISDKLSKALNLKLNDAVYSYFFQDKIRARKFIINGIYSTTLSDFDNLFIICNTNVIQELNGWDSIQISSAEIVLTDFDKLDRVYSSVQSIVGNKFDNNRLLYNTQTVKEVYFQIFSWLDMLDINAYIIIVLMMAVAGFNMISGLLILMLSKTQDIGLFQVLGMRGRQLREIFGVTVILFVLKGMFCGNLVGLFIILSQYYFKLIPLDPKYYYTDFVPVSLNFPYLVFLNLAVIVFSILLMILSTNIVTKMQPAKSVRFE